MVEYRNTDAAEYDYSVADSYDSNEEEQTEEEEEEQTEEEEEEQTEEEEETKQVEVPDIAGKEAEEASKLVEKSGLLYEVSKEEYSDEVPAACVISQKPKTGTIVDGGSVVKAVISKGVEQIEVPNVVGMSEEEATDALISVNLGILPTQDYSSSVGAGAVISQAVEAGNSVDKGTPVGVVISLGPKPQSKPAASSNTSTNSAPVQQAPSDPTDFEVKPSGLY